MNGKKINAYAFTDFTPAYTYITLPHLQYRKWLNFSVRIYRTAEDNLICQI